MKRQLSTQQLFQHWLAGLLCVGLIGLGYTLPWTGRMGGIVTGADLLRVGLRFGSFSFLALWPLSISFGPIAEILTLGKSSTSAIIVRVSTLAVSTLVAGVVLGLIVTRGYSGWGRIFEGYYCVMLGVTGLWVVNGWRMLKPLSHLSERPKDYETTAY